MSQLFYTIEYRNERGVWRPLRYGMNRFNVIDEAIAQVCKYDPDGLFLADYRIKCDGNVVYTALDHANASRPAK